MIRYVAAFVFGVLVGALTIWLTINTNSNSYFSLGEDMILENGSLLKKGTLIQYDQGMNEGFSRYILYINSTSMNIKKIKEPSKNNLIIPFWLYEIDNLKENN